MSKPIPDLINAIPVLVRTDLVSFAAGGPPKAVPPFPIGYHIAPWRGQIFFKPLDQLGNVDRLSQNWMSLNAEARSSVAQRGEKDDGRSLQLRISTDFAC